MEEQECDEDGEKSMREKAHECPVPKPRGRIGEVLGFTIEEREEDDRGTRPVS